MENYRFAYLFGSLIFGLIWLIIYLLRPDLRKEQLFMSLLISVGGVLEPLFFNEYWRPQFIVSIPKFNVGIESILLCFFYGGIASTLYEFVFDDILKKTTRENKKVRALEMIVSILTGVTLSQILYLVLHMNIIYVTSLGLMTIGCSLIWFRKDLLLSAFINGIIMSMIAFIILVFFGFIFSGIFDVWWRIDLLTGISLLNVPLEEIIWHFALGFAVGPMYEVWKGYGDFKKNLF